jgi:hypothetical protein
MLTMAPGLDIEPYPDQQIAILDRAHWADWLDPSVPALAAEAASRGDADSRASWLSCLCMQCSATFGASASATPAALTPDETTKRTSGRLPDWSQMPNRWLLTAMRTAAQPWKA